ncbi:MAG TPA: D-alanyl-D-alanine carboxypeptidase family protein, partial [Croceibacterium sp.]|nr:D-alanyl-D-alanine carboxypeptidase family protein [Croceibacterium sp.]
AILKYLTTFRLGLALGLASLPAIPLAAPADPIVLRPTTAAPVPDEIPVALLIDLSSGQTLFSREADRRFVPASVTKVMTAYTAFRLIGQGKIDPRSQITVSQELADLWSGEGSSMFLKAGDRVSLGQLLLGVTTVSANDGAVALATAATGSLDAWLALMNRNAAELGMRDTHFGTPNGWPDEGQTYTSARDLAILAEALTTRYPELYRGYFGRRGMKYGEITQANHDPVTGVVEGADGIKTGFTRQSGYNFLGSAERDGRRLVMVIAAAPSASIRNKTARDLLRWGFEAFESRPILPAGLAVGHAAVQNGASYDVALRTRRPVLASVPQGAEDRVRLSIRYRGPVEAPIAKGQEVAFLHVEVPGQQPHEVPLVAAEPVARANLLERLRNGLVGLVS